MILVPTDCEQSAKYPQAWYFVPKLLSFHIHNFHGHNLHTHWRVDTPSTHRTNPEPSKYHLKAYCVQKRPSGRNSTSRAATDIQTAKKESLCYPRHEYLLNLNVRETSLLISSLLIMIEAF